MFDKGESIKFEDFVALTSREKNANNLFEHLIKAVSQHGFDRVIFSIANDDELSEEQRKIGVFHNYPGDWQKFYLEKELNRIDPVLRYAAQNLGSFRWKEIEEKVTLTDKQKSCLRMGEEAGLYNGVGIPLRGRRAQLAGVALATSQKIDACDESIDLVNAYCNQFYVAYKRLLAAPRDIEVAISLSKKEQEILSWAGMGKTDEDIATILGISRNTVDTHMRHIFEKMGVNSRILAVVKALTYGLISY